MKLSNSQFDKKFIPAKYIARYFSLNSSAEMQELNLFPNIKEISESMAMYYCVANYLSNWELDINLKNENINIFVFGDGKTPRTAGLFSFMTKWKTYSIDPNMGDKNFSSIKRLSIYKQKEKDFICPSLDSNSINIIILPHSHADIDLCWNKINHDKKWLISMPCFYPKRLKQECFIYIDNNIISPKNSIEIYCSYKKLNYTKNEQ